MGFVIIFLLIFRVPDTCNGPSLDKSVILYDATEEDLMKTIEREFS